MTKTAAKVFAADHERMNAQLEALGAVVTLVDGFQYIDESKAPAGLLRAYRGLMQFGYANGLI